MARDPEKRRLASRKWRLANPDYNKAWRAANPDKVKAHHLMTQRRRQGMADVTAEKRHGECPICLKMKPLVWDHDHATGKHRGWLCRSCNLHLGALGDSIEALDRARAYLLAGTTSRC